ncbi:lipopolysaccharide export system permease protein [Roseovarius sp. MBR-154]
MRFRLDRYMLRNILGVLAALIAVALGMLMLERLIRIADLIAGSDNALEAGARMIANLMPHYLGMALPGALLIATIIATERLSRSGEMVALLSTGVSLRRVARPLVLLGLFLAIASIVNSGFLQPLARYNYREVVHELRQSSIVTAFKERKFIQFDDRVVWTSHVDFSGRELGETFIVETAEDGSRRFIAGQSGHLNEEDNRTWQIIMANAMLGNVPATITNGAGNRLSTESVTWTLPTPLDGYRDRGDDQRELTLPELVTGSYPSQGQNIDRAAAEANLHDRLSRAILLTALPLIGVVLGLTLGRMGRSGGLAIGIVLLLVVQKLLEYGLELAQRGTLPPWAGTWPIVALVLALAIYTFGRTAQGRTPLPRLIARLRRSRAPADPDKNTTAAR